jgi:hypothetical protein
MSSYVKWSDVRAEFVERAGGEEAVAEGKRKLLAECAAWSDDLQPVPDADPIRNDTEPEER